MENYVNFKTEEQRDKVLTLFSYVLGGGKNLNDLSVESLKNVLSLEEIALFFELMAKYLNDKVYTETESKQK